MVNLSAVHADGLPGGFVAARTGKGAPAEWKVLDDPTASSGRVLAQVIPIRESLDSRGIPKSAAKMFQTGKRRRVCHGPSDRGERRLYERRGSPVCQAGKGWRASAQTLAIAAVLDGASREEAALVGGMDRQTLRDWVIRFNSRGP